MLMEDLIIWILVCYGITNGVTGSTLTYPIRQKAKKIHTKLGDLLECPMCFGFWAGLFVSLLWLSPTNNLFLDCFISSGTCWLIHLWEESVL
jgi:hypothetical protein